MTFSRKGILPLLLGVSLISCANAKPKSVLSQYQQALQSRDAKSIYKLSDNDFRSIHSVTEIEKYLSENEADAKSLAELLAEDTVATALRGTIELASGHVVHLIFEDGRWKVRAGGIPFDRFDSPQAALNAFFRAYRDGRLEVLRQLIPSNYASRYLDDAQLEAHLERIRSRVVAAENRLPKVPKAKEKGETAEITYGDGFKVSFIKEDGSWKISDLE